MSKPEDLLDAMAHSVMTPPKSCPVASPELPIETSSTPPLPLQCPPNSVLFLL